jgi:hypothetical protein
MRDLTQVSEQFQKKGDSLFVLFCICCWKQKKLNTLCPHVLSWVEYYVWQSTQLNSWQASLYSNSTHSNHVRSWCQPYRGHRHVGEDGSGFHRRGQRNVWTSSRSPFVVELKKQKLLWTQPTLRFPRCKCSWDDHSVTNVKNIYSRDSKDFLVFCALSFNLTTTNLSIIY